MPPTGSDRNLTFVNIPPAGATMIGSPQKYYMAYYLKSRHREIFVVDVFLTLVSPTSTDCLDMAVTLNGIFSKSEVSWR